MSILDKVRRWIDGETSELVLEQAARDAQIKPRSKAEEFIVKIAREVEGVMQREMVPLPRARRSSRANTPFFSQAKTIKIGREPNAAAWNKGFITYLPSVRRRSPDGKSLRRVRL